MGNSLASTQSSLAVQEWKFVPLGRPSAVRRSYGWPVLEGSIAIELEQHSLGGAEAPWWHQICKRCFEKKTEPCLGGHMLVEPLKTQFTTAHVVLAPFRATFELDASPTCMGHRNLKWWFIWNFPVMVHVHSSLLAWNKFGQPGTKAGTWPQKLHGPSMFEINWNCTAWGCAAEARWWMQQPLN